MAILGSLVAIGAAVAFAAMGGLVLWGGWIMLRREVFTGFISAQPSPLERAFTLVCTALPLLVVGLFGIATAARFFALAFGI